MPNSTRLWKLLKIAEFRTPTPHDVWKKGSKILKLLLVHNCFTLAMTNKLVVITNSLKVPKIKKILLYEMKFLVPNYSCQQNPWLGGYHPPIPVFSVLNWVCWTPLNKIPGYTTASRNPVILSVEVDGVARFLWRSLMSDMFSWLVFRCQLACMRLLFKHYVVEHEHAYIPMRWN